MSDAEKTSTGLDHPVMDAVSNVPAVIWFLSGVFLLAMVTAAHLGLLTGVEVFAGGLISIGVGKAFAHMFTG